MPRKPIDWEAVEMFFSGGETGVERMAMHIIEQPDLWAEMKWPEVERVAKQVKIGRSVADIVVWHVDGSLTIVEVKRATCLCENIAPASGNLRTNLSWRCRIFKLSTSVVSWLCQGNSLSM